MRQPIKLEQLEILMALYSERDLSTPIREVARLRMITDFIFERKEAQTGVTRKRIALAVRKLEQAHEKVQSTKYKVYIIYNDFILSPFCRHFISYLV